MANLLVVKNIGAGTMDLVSFAKIIEFNTSIYLLYWLVCITTINNRSQNNKCEFQTKTKQPKRIFGSKYGEAIYIICSV